MKAHFPISSLFRVPCATICFIFSLFIMVMQVLLLWPLLWQCHSFYNYAKKGFMDVWVHSLRLGSQLDRAAM